MWRYHTLIMEGETREELVYLHKSRPVLCANAVMTRYYRRGRIFVVTTDEDELYARCCAQSLNKGHDVFISQVFAPKGSVTTYHYKAVPDILAPILPEKE